MNSLFRWTSMVIAAVAISAITGILLTQVATAKMEALPIGATVPDFTLKDTTGTAHSLAQYEDKIVVLNFCSQACPFSRGADPSINELAKTYGEKGVVFLGIDSNKNQRPEDIQKYIDETGIPYPILKDEGTTLADAVGARVTPEIYIKGKDGKLVYHGAPDNRSGPASTPTEHYLKDALEALLAGEPIEKTSVKAWGCGINRAG